MPEKKRWGAMTEEEIEAIREKKCKKCIYVAHANSRTQMQCNYLLITGKRRDCRMEECDKFRKGKPMGEGGHFDNYYGPDSKRRRRAPTRTHIGVLMETRMKTMVITQKQLSKACGVSDQVIGSWRIGKAKPSEKNLAKVCMVLEIPMEQAEAAVEKGMLGGGGG